MTAEIEQDEQLPEALVEELKRVDAAPAVITARVDRALGDMAQAHFSSRPGPTMAAPRVGRGRGLRASRRAVHDEPP